MRVIALLLLGSLVFILAGCGGSGGDAPPTPEGRLIVIEVTADGCAPLAIPVTEGEKVIIEVNNMTDVEARLGGARIGPQGTRRFPTTMNDAPGRDYLTCEGPSGEVQEVVFEGLSDD